MGKVIEMKEAVKKPRIGFCCLPGLTNFIQPIIDSFIEKGYKVNTCFKTSQDELVAIIRDSDVIFIEWANEIAEFITNKLADRLVNKVVVIRLHSYEFLHGHLQTINWNKVDGVVFVAEHVRELSAQLWKQIGVTKDFPTFVITNGVDVEKFVMPEKRERDFNLAMVAAISNKKGPMLIIQAMAALVKKNPKYTLYIAGEFQEPRYQIYMSYMIEKLGLKDNIFLQGKKEDIPNWLLNKSHIICTSPWEGSPVGIVEAMATGCKPLIHHFPGADKLFPKEYLWKTVQEFVDMVLDLTFTPEKYRELVVEEFNIKKKLQIYEQVIEEVTSGVEFVEEVKDDSKVTAVIAVKNGEATIMNAIDSLFAQTHKLERIIVVNDNSDDNTEKILATKIEEQVKKMLEKEDSKPDLVQIICLETQWIFKARNIGAKQVKTPFMFFLDADDTVEPTYVEEALKLIVDNKQIGFVYPDQTVHKDGTIDVFEVPNFDPEILVKRNYVSYCSLLRTEFLKEANGFNEYYNDCRNHLTEWDLWLRFITEGFDGAHLSKPLFNYSRYKEQVSQNYERDRVDMHFQIVSQLDSALTMSGDGVRTLLVCKVDDFLNGMYDDEKAKNGVLLTYFYDVVEKHFGKDKVLEKYVLFVSRTSPNEIVDNDDIQKLYRN